MRVSHRVSRMRRAHVCEVDDLPRCARAPRPASDQLMKLRTRVRLLSGEAHEVIYARASQFPLPPSPPLCMRAGGGVRKYLLREVHVPYIAAQTILNAASARMLRVSYGVM